MSETMSMNVEFRNRPAVFAACKRMGIECREGTFDLFRSKEKGLGIFLDGWKFPVILKEDGSVRFDNYHGSWGDELRLNELRAYYGVEATKSEMWLKGYAVTETETQNGIELQIEIPD